MADNSVHSENKLIGDSTEFGRLHKRKISSLHKLVSFRCFVPPAMTGEQLNAPSQVFPGHVKQFGGKNRDQAQ